MSFIVGCCCSVTQSCLTLCDPMPCSMPGLPVLLHLPEFAQVHVHCNQWCHLAISSSEALFPFCPQSFPASGTFPMSWLFTSDDQNTGVSASESELPTSFQGWFPLRLTGLVSSLSKTLRSLLQHYSLKMWILWHSAFFMVQVTQSYVTIGKTIALTIGTLSAE